MHAAGQAFLAAAAGVLAGALARGGPPMAVGSTVVVDPGKILGTTEAYATLVLAIAGVLAALVKLAGGALSAWAEAHLAGEVGGRLRVAVLDDVLDFDRLRTPGHGDHGSTARGASRTYPGGWWFSSRAARWGRFLARGARNIRSFLSTHRSEKRDQRAAQQKNTSHLDDGRLSHADRLTALTSHVVDVEQGVAHGVLSELRAIVQLAPLGGLLVLLAPELAVSAAVVLGGFALFAFTLRRAFKRAHARAAASAGALIEAADEAVRHADLWATYGAKRRIRSHVLAVGQAIVHEAAHIRLRASLLSSTSEVLGAMALVLALLLAARGALGVDHGTVVPFAIVFFMAYRPLRDLVDARLVRARGEEALGAALGRRAENRSANAAPMSLRTAWALEPLVLSGVRARHGAHLPLSMEVPPGSIVAVVGPTGIGKTSLLRGLLGLESLAEGEIRYGSRRLECAGVGPSQRPLAWVPQDAPIVGDTLANNVALGRADDDAVIPDPSPVLAELGNESLARSLGEQVLGTMRPLSGGERQWIAVARALATGLPVLLLDEPTSALDGASQDRLLEAIARLRGKRTVIVVTHRPEPLAIADMVAHLGVEDSRSDRAPSIPRPFHRPHLDENGLG